MQTARIALSLIQRERCKGAAALERATHTFGRFGVEISTRARVGGREMGKDTLGKFNFIFGADGHRWGESIRSVVIVFALIGLELQQHVALCPVQKHPTHFRCHLPPFASH